MPPFIQKVSELYLNLVNKISNIPLKINPFLGKNSIEFARKSIHIMSILIPLVHRFVLHNNKLISIPILFGMLAIALSVELLRLQNRNFRKLFNLLFGILLRKHEKTDFTGASYLLTSAIVCIAFFPAEIAFAALAFLSIGDTFAALVGMNFGKRKFCFNKKSFEGFLACFISTLIFGLLCVILFKDPKYLTPPVAYFGALAAAIFETVNIPIDDNVKIPVCSGIVMCLTYLAT